MCLQFRQQVGVVDLCALQAERHDGLLLCGERISKLLLLGRRDRLAIVCSETLCCSCQSAMRCSASSEECSASARQAARSRGGEIGPGGVPPSPLCSKAASAGAVGGCCTAARYHDLKRLNSYFLTSGGCAALHNAPLCLCACWFSSRSDVPRASRWAGRRRPTPQARPCRSARSTRRP